MTSINEMRIISMFSGLKNEKKFIYKRCYLRKNLCYKLTKVTSYLRKFVCNCFTNGIWHLGHFIEHMIIIPACIMFKGIGF